MVTETEASAEPRIPLSQDRILRAAVDLADKSGIDAVSMRKVGQELGVEAMSLYNHVANKEQMLNGMVDVVVAEIPTVEFQSDWKTTMREQAMVAREVMARHSWAPQVIETRTDMSPTLIGYMDAIVGLFREGGFSLELIHHAMHLIGSRVLGFTQELFDDSGPIDEDPEVAAVMLRQMLAAYPNISAMLDVVNHEEESIVGSGCDDRIEFCFGLDLMLNGLERLRDAGG